MMAKIKEKIKKYKITRRNQQHLLAFRSAQKTRVKKNTVLFESLHAKSVDGHIYHIIKSLLMRQKNEIKIYVVTKDFEIFENKFSAEELKNIHFVKHMSKEYGKLLATCEFLINDNTFYPFFSKRKEQKYFNIWHGTPLKTLGKDMEDFLGISNVQRNFFMSDAIIVSNNYTKDILVNSHNIDNIYSGKVVVGPSPRNAPLFSENIEKSIREKYRLTNKKVVFYMPTWRGVSGNVREDKDKIYNDLKHLSQNLDDSTVVYFKAHTMQADFKISDLPGIRKFPEECELYNFLSCVDILVTDYSSVMYDFLNKNKKIVLYTYDKDYYLKSRGVYEDIDEYPFTQVQTVEQLVQEIKASNSKIEYASMKERFCKYDGEDGAKLITDYIFFNRKQDRIKEYSIGNGKENVFIFSGGLWDNGITTALLNTLNAIDTSKRNYILVFGKSKISKNHLFRLQNLPKGVLYYPISGITIMSFFERFIYTQYLKREKLNLKFVKSKIYDVYQNEIRRIFGDVKVDWFIHYTGFDRKYAELVEYMNTNTAIFVHTDMFEDYKNKKNYNKKVLYNAYKAATKIILVNKNLHDGFQENLPEVAGKLEVVNNFLGENRVRQLAEESVISSLINVRFDSVDSSHLIFDPIQRYYAQLLNNETVEENSMTTIHQNISHSITDVVSSNLYIENKVLSNKKVENLIKHEMYKRYLTENYPYRNELIRKLEGNLNMPFEESEKIVDDILKQDIKLQEIKLTFPHFMNIIEDYRKVKNMQGENPAEMMNFKMDIIGHKENFDKEFLLDIVIKEFGISKMRMLNEVMDPNITVFMNIGRYDLQKGQERLVSAFERYNKENPNSRLIMVAPYGPIKKQVVSKVKNSEARKNIYLLGRMDNPYPLLKMVDAFVLSSYYEGLGLVVYEALSLDTDVITTNLETTTEYLNDNQATIVDNSEQGIYEGFVRYNNSDKSKEKFNFDSYNKQSIQEFEGIFSVRK